MLAAMILCAGFGTRLRPLTEVVPKPLLRVGDRPALLHTVDILQKGGFGPLVVNAHHLGAQLRVALPADVRVIAEQVILGTAGGVANASAALGDGDVLVWNGDIVAQPDTVALVRTHRASAGDAPDITMLAQPRPMGEGTLGVGAADRVVRLRGERFGEETSGAEFLGIQVLSPRARARLPAQGCLIGDLALPLLRSGGSVRVAWHHDAWDDIGSPSALLGANLRWLRRAGARHWVASSAVVDGAVELVNTVVGSDGVVLGRGQVAQCLVLDGGRLEAPAQGCIALPNGAVLAVDGAGRQR